MRFHVVSLPHTQTLRAAYSACAYTQKVRKFCNMMHDLGHEVILYAGYHSDARCDVLVPCITDVGCETATPPGKHYTEAVWDPSLPHWRTFNANAIAAIAVRQQPHDFICVIGGKAHQAIADAFPHLMTVEFGIGYSGTFSKYRVFESYAWMHSCYAANKEPTAVDGAWFDAVIPNYFEVDDFPFRKSKAASFAYVGRLVDRKGYDIAIETCAAIGAELVLAGPGVPPSGHKHVRYAGVVGPRQRGEIMSRARALFAPTKYIEPFGGVAVEAMLCGTPVISTDWGAFTETVENGLTGYRCRTLQEFITAALTVDELDPLTIRNRASSRYSTEVVAKQYETYFRRLLQLWGEGWYERTA